MPPGLMSHRKSRHLVWEMENGDLGLGLGIGESGLANGAAGKCFRRQGKHQVHNSHSPSGASVV